VVNQCVIKNDGGQSKSTNILEIKNQPPPDSNLTRNDGQAALLSHVAWACVSFKKLRFWKPLKIPL